MQRLPDHQLNEIESRLLSIGMPRYLDEDRKPSGVYKELAHQIVGLAKLKIGANMLRMPTDLDSLGKRIGHRLWGSWWSMRQLWSVSVVDAVSLLEKT